MYLIIDPTFIPVNNFPGLNRVFPPVIVPPIIPFGNLNLSRKQFAVNCENPVEALCFTDLMSSSEYAVTTAAKRKATKKGKQVSKQPKSIADKTARHRKNKKKRKKA